MGYDIFVQDLPTDISSVAEIPDDFEPNSIGHRASFIQTIRTIAPYADVSDPAWVVIEKDAIYRIEVNFGEVEDISSFAFHVLGGSEARQLISQVLRVHGLRALDPQEDSGLFQESVK